MVLQVLVLAAQNAVDYKYLGVASSGSTLFRQIGGSIGVAVFGAIFVNQLTATSREAARRGAHSDCGEPGRDQATSAAIHDVYVKAITDALHPVFLVAAGLAVVGFLLTWLLREVPLKTTAQAPSAGDGFHAARGDDAFREIERWLSRLAERDQRWEAYEQLAARAGVDLAPPELWLLTRLGERTPLTEAQLIEQVPADPERVAEALEQLRQRSLVGARNGDAIDLTALGREDYERIVTARCDGLRELLDGWEPEEHAELQQLIDNLGRDLVSEIPTP